MLGIEQVFLSGSTSITGRTPRSNAKVSEFAAMCRNYHCRCDYTSAAQWRDSLLWGELSGVLTKSESNDLDTTDFNRRSFKFSLTRRSCPVYPSFFELGLTASR